MSRECHIASQNITQYCAMSCDIMQYIVWHIARHHTTYHSTSCHITWNSVISRNNAWYHTFVRHCAIPHDCCMVYNNVVRCCTTCRTMLCYMSHYIFNYIVLYCDCEVMSYRWHASAIWITCAIQLLNIGGVGSNHSRLHTIVKNTDYLCNFFAW